VPGISSNVLATINHISLSGALAGEHAKSLDLLTKEWLELPVQIHVFDFKQVTKITKVFYASTLKFKREAELKQTKLVSINVNPEILAQLKADGMDRAFGYMANAMLNDRPPFKDSLEEARTWLIKYAVEAGRNAMNAMFNTTVAADENYKETPSDFRPEKYFKVAVIHGDNTRFKTTFRLFFEKSTLEALSKTIADQTRTQVDTELLLSTATELLNIIYTSVKSKINDDRGYDLPPAIPSLVDPAQVAKETMPGGKSKSWVPFVTPLGAYYLQIEMGV
jgi:hypothetical protein